MSTQRFNTGNPIGSNSPLDRSDNTRNLDVAVLSDEDTFQDRLGKSRLTWAGIVRAGSGDPAIAVDAAQRAETAADNAVDDAARAEAAASQVQQDAEQITQDAAQQAVTDVVIAVDGAVDRAEDAASRSENARDAAFINADVYPDVAAGLAAVADGEQFQVVEGDEIVRYSRDSSSSQTEVARYPSASIVTRLDHSLGGARVVTASRNLFDLSAAETGLRVSLSTGETFNNADYTASDFIEVEPFTRYKWNMGTQYAIYDLGKVFISGGNGPYMDSGAGAFVRFDTLTSNTPTQMFAKTDDYPTEYEPFSEGVDIPGLVYDRQRVEEVIFPVERTLRGDLKVSYPNIPFLTRLSINLYDKDAPGVIHGYRLDPYSGSMIVNASDNVSDYIPVEPGGTYSVSEGNRTCEYGADKAFLSGHGTGIATFTVGPDTRFIRTTVRAAILDDLVLIEGDQTPAIYQPYNVWAFDETITGAGSEVRWSGKKWNVMGDSITASTEAYWRDLARELRFSEARNYGISGSAVAVRNPPRDLDAMCIRYADMDDDADLITVMCGTNDYNQVTLGEFTDSVNTTFYGALHILCSGLIEKYPDKTIAFLTLPPRANMHSPAPMDGKTVWDYADAIKEVCAYYAIPVFDTLRSTQLRPFNEQNKVAFMPDGLHPNAEGHKMIALNMTPFLMGL